MIQFRQESNLVRHARRELELIGESPETIDWYLKVVQTFADFDHSGGSACVAILTLNQLLMFRNVSPLTNDLNEWILVGPDVWQSSRRSDAFSTNGGKTHYFLEEGKDPIKYYITKEKKS